MEIIIIQENPGKSAKIYEIFEIQWKSSEARKPAWNRTKATIGPTGRTLRPWMILELYDAKSVKNYENHWIL